ncbi:hypothetical protein DSO57_1010231 [Entomophthora muscae]|uniref:Uncharacterized protein n=1 Tax=Entomophthora muscae TaxID=34485 RepID=A0ACC2RXJ4_9FUNG|nr:hypothetical protein DSO57_1010231 [Entomophthora muscae]
MNLWFKQILPYLVLVTLHLNSSQVDYQAATPSQDQSAESPQALYRPPGVPFGPVHFTEYPPTRPIQTYFVPMTPSLTPRPYCPLEPTATAKTTYTQLFGVLYITLTGLMDSVILNSGPWSLLGQSVSYIIKLAPILWWALPVSLTVPRPEPPNASTYDWLPDQMEEIIKSCPRCSVCLTPFWEGYYLCGSIPPESQDKDHLGH